MEEENNNNELFEIYDSQEVYLKDRKISRAKSIIIGILLIIPGIIAVILGLILLLGGVFQLGENGVFAVVFGGAELFFGVPSVIGGVLSFKRENHKIVLMCAIISIFILVIPGIVAVILLFLAEDEFKS